MFFAFSGIEIQGLSSQIALLHFDLSKVLMSRFQVLRDALGEKGWELSPVELASGCWWAKEIWMLESTWSPREKRIYLLLLVDPHWEDDHNNVPDRAVWSVGLSHEIPDSRPLSEIWNHGIKNEYAVMVLSLIHI